MLATRDVSMPEDAGKLECVDLRDSLQTVLSGVQCQLWVEISTLVQLTVNIIAYSSRIGRGWVDVLDAGL